MKKLPLVIFFLLIAGIIFFLWGSRNNIRLSGAMVETNVIITDEGFSPDSIVVEAGTIVNWKNEGKLAHWPASNFHPTHSLYPEQGGCISSKFDACKGLKTGESFSFKLDKIGKWPVHDHLFPGLVMMVEVTGSNSSIVSSADLKTLNYGEQLSVIKNLAQQDPEKAWAYIKKSFIINGQVVGNAHEFSHIIGNKSYEKYGIDGVKICDESFAFGCFHGVTEKMLLAKGTRSLKSIQDQCLKRFPPGKSQNYSGCIHGAGHGLYTWEAGNIKKALADCDVLDESYRMYCYDGVFMENSFVPTNRVVDSENPWKFCVDLNERYHLNCARYQSQIFLGSSSHSIIQAGKYCKEGTSSLLRDTCYESLGYYIAQTFLGKIPDIWKNCQQMPEEKGIALCSRGAAVETVFQRYSDWENSAPELCKKLSEPTRTGCLEHINKMIKK